MQAKSNPKGIRAAENAASEPPHAILQGAGMNHVLNKKQQKIARTSQFPQGGQPIPARPSGYADRNNDNQKLNEDLSVQARDDLHTLYPFSTGDPQDAKWALHEQYLKGNRDTIPNIGEVFVPEEYFQYCERKYAQQLQDEFETFLFQQIDLTKPESREWWEARFPEFTQKFKNAWEMELEYKKKLGLIQINGVQNMSDMWFLFARAKGLDNFATRYTGIVPIADRVPTTFTAFQHLKNPNNVSADGLMGRNPPPVSLEGRAIIGQLKSDPNLPPPRGITRFNPSQISSYGQRQ